MSSTFAFFASRRFLPLFSTQFLGAFNDNLLKTAFLVWVSYAGLSFAGLPAAQIVNLASGLFILPFFLFSATAGRLAEKIDKARVARWVKLSELAIMLLAALGFSQHHAGVLLLALFLMGAHSTFFGPVKYAMLPQHLRPHELIGGNGLIEMGTFIAILLGQMAGGMLALHSLPLTIALLMLAAALGWASSRTIPPAPPSAPDLPLHLNLWRDTADLLCQARRTPALWTAMLGISWFWLLGAVYLTQLPTFTRLHLGGDPQVYTLILAVFSVAIGLGSMLCARLSHAQLRLGWVGVGLLGMTVAGLDLYAASHARHSGELMGLATYLAHPAAWRQLLDFALLGGFGGLFTVPLYTWLQTASPEDFRAQAIAANNIVNGLFMVAAAALSAVLLAWLDSIALLFLCVAVCNLPALWWLARREPMLWPWRRQG
jgi:MFS family permease